MALHDANTHMWGHMETIWSLLKVIR
jgi:hypothetical protein